ncbi:phospholipase A and acyltransferase 3-like [Puntigrus tetrazona]|uniref:phospholipase A and acyltransferase 3-like n=1 Tax=Puntigrus tetrazona TaxID=1606681 RepID=UPI001C8A73EE|nr:phospholipase A and acyltransferase 3-like [Puntigrus tetrazona]XP_043112647.1 phospholipase A and acyltransferase 3-like [Puntigrus tetrazona]
MAEYEKKPEPGDLIEIFRGLYQHWAIYVGEGYVIHLAPPSEQPEAGANSFMSVLHDRATVKKEELHEVVGDNEYRVNNRLDEKYEPRPVREILRDAHRFLGEQLPYSVLTGNCEHFVTELRYGKPQSRQVRDAVQTFAAAAGAGIGLGIIAYAISNFLRSKDKEKQTQ